MTPYEELNQELLKAGVPAFRFMDISGTPVDAMVNDGHSSHPHQDILLAYLPKVTNREKGMIVRALSEKQNKKAVPYLIALLEDKENQDQLDRWVVSNALYIINDKASYPQIVKLCRDGDLGSDRQPLLRILARIKTNEVFSLLVELLEDDDLKGSAIEALGRFGDPKGISILERVTVKKGLYEFKARETALRRLKKKVALTKG